MADQQVTKETDGAKVTNAKNCTTHRQIKALKKLYGTKKMHVFESVV